MHDRGYRNGTAHRIAALALSLGALASVSPAQSETAHHIRAQFETSFTPGAIQAGAAPEGVGESRTG
jgi:hypothetical protein